MISYGCDVPGGRYECTDCGYVLSLKNGGALPPCHKASGELRHTRMAWIPYSGDNTEDSSPYPHPTPSPSQT